MDGRLDSQGEISIPDESLIVSQNREICGKNDTITLTYGLTVDTHAKF